MNVLPTTDAARLALARDALSNVMNFAEQVVQRARNDDLDDPVEVESMLCQIGSIAQLALASTVDAPEAALQDLSHWVCWRGFHVSTLPVAG